MDEQAQDFAAALNLANRDRDKLRARIAELEKQVTDKPGSHSTGQEEARHREACSYVSGGWVCVRGCQARRAMIAKGPGPPLVAPSEAAARIYEEARTLAHGMEGWDAFYVLIVAELRAAYREGRETNNREWAGIYNAADARFRAAEERARTARRVLAHAAGRDHRDTSWCDGCAEVRRALSEPPKETPE